MRTYQALALIGGIFGIVVVPILVLVFSVGLAFLAAFDDDPGTSGEEQELLGSIGLVVTLAGSITAIVLAFKLDSSRTAGYVLLGVTAAMAAATHAFGVISWAFLLAAGISALRYR